jgi:NAD(P)H-dependent flavin oxidoreductase YrpB (nitropropane dioxygenase family)
LKQDIQPGAAFGVDLLLPAVGGEARATNYDYTHGQLSELIDVMIEEGARLFVTAVGVPPMWVVKKLHTAGIMVMNMVGSPKHVAKALAVGVDAVCAQGTEAGGHTGDVSTLVLVPQCVDIVAGHTSPLHGGPVVVVGAGGIFDGRGVAAVLALGAEAAWVGTRFVAATEAGAGPRHQNAIVGSESDDTIRTLIYSGRPMRIQKSDYVMDWELHRKEEATALLAQGKRVHKTELARREALGDPLDFASTYPIIFGQACGGIKEVKSAAEIVDELVAGAVRAVKLNHSRLLAAHL